ncbi:anti-sigma factor family protein [Kitasatospora cathayae]|uniref:Zf-HC2 domain-containing protein n=1 Tax=Kitasatospora cathayae TaxID=3004092 RepID=A0ABY7QFY5_9ACTN|nr:zf-HC2 domain-containing protein [Kitasatospora sp. HUAS 3-15]WBP91179.1 zf-HC2 domain-containing protein [Kitasatospora sp. HUAS 3-15]
MRTLNGDHDAVRLSLGGYVLGRLSPAETEQVRAHLADCAECQAEHAELAGLPALLATVSEAEAVGEVPPAPSEELADRLVQRAAASERAQPEPEPAATAVPLGPQRTGRSRLDRLLQQAASRRRTAVRRQLVGVAAAATLVAAAASGGTWLATVASTGSQVAQPAPTSPAPVRTFSGTDPTTGVSASVEVSPAAWGSTLRVTAKGAPAGITCSLQAVGITGATATAATWQAGDYPGGAKVSGTVPMSPGMISHFEIDAGDGQRLLTVPA